MAPHFTNSLRLSSAASQLPFIQTLFTRGDDMPLIVPVMLGSASPALTDTLATALDAFRQVRLILRVILWHEVILRVILRVILTSRRVPPDHRRHQQPARPLRLLLRPRPLLRRARGARPGPDHAAAHRPGRRPRPGSLLCRAREQGESDNTIIGI